LKDPSDFILAEYLAGITDELDRVYDEWTEMPDWERARRVDKARKQLRKLSGFFREQYLKKANPIKFRTYSDELCDIPGATLTPITEEDA